MTEPDEPLEDIAASMLNGVMIFRLGAVLPALFVWQVVNHGIDLTVGPDVDALFDAGLFVVLTLISFQFMWWGVRTVRKGVTALRRRRSGSPAD